MPPPAAPNRIRYRGSVTVKNTGSPLKWAERFDRLERELGGVREGQRDPVHSAHVRPGAVGELSRPAPRQDHPPAPQNARRAGTVTDRYADARHRRVVPQGMQGNRREPR